MSTPDTHKNMNDNLSMDELVAENSALREKLRSLENEKEARRKTQFIANAADQLLTMIDRDYRYESVNQAYCRARGQRPRDVVGRTVADVWGRMQFEAIIKPKLDHCFAGKVASSEDWFKFDGKELRCFQVTYNPYRNDQGRITHAVVVTHDITDRKSAEAELKKAHDRLERRVASRTEALEKANIQLRNEIEERKRVVKALKESEERYRSVSRDMPALVCRYPRRRPPHLCQHAFQKPLWDFRRTTRFHNDFRLLSIQRKKAHAKASGAASPRKAHGHP